MSFSTPFRSVLQKSVAEVYIVNTCTRIYALIVQDVRLCAYNNIIIFCYLHSCHGFYFCTKNLKQEAYRHWRSPEYPIYEVKILTRLSSDCYPCLLLFNVLKLKKKIHKGEGRRGSQRDLGLFTPQFQVPKIITFR